MRHAAADRCDRARNFMPQRHRLSDPDRAESAVMVIMQVRAADAAGGDFYAHFVRTGRGIGNIVDPEVFRGMDDDGSHELCSPVFVRAYIAASMPPST